MVRNGFAFVAHDRNFGAVKGIEVDNVYAVSVYQRAVRAINENSIEYYTSCDNDLSILKECPTIKYVRVTAEATLKTLIGLKNLRGVIVCGLYGENEKFDFRRLEQVEQLGMLGGGKNHTWLEMLQLKKLWIEPFPVQDLSCLNHLQNLEFLSVEVGKMSSLEGAEHLQKLREIEIGCCSKLKNIEDLKLLKNLSYLQISDCDHIENIEEALRCLKTVKELKLLNVFHTSTRGRLNNLQFVNDMDSLKSFISNYIIKSNDLTPLLHLENADIFAENKKYNIKNDMLPKYKKG